MGRSVVNRTGVASLRGGSRGARRAKPPRPAATPPREGNFGSRNFDRAVWAKRPWQLFVNGFATTYVWDGSDYLQARTVSDVTTYENVRAQILALDLDGSERLLVPDTLGSVVKLLDASGNETYDAVYWPLGSVRSSAGLNDTNAGYVGTWGYHVDGSRKLYIRARVYDPVMGRWYSTVRSSARVIGEHPFSYSLNEPISYIDPSGDFPSLAECKRRGGKSCFHCANAVLVKKLRQCPKAACQAANTLCNTRVPCGPCGMCSTPSAPSSCFDFGSIHSFGEFLRGSNESTVSGWDCGASCGGYGGGDKLAHCFKGCVVQVCIGHHCGLIGDDPHEDDVDAEWLGYWIGTWIFGPPPHAMSQCLEKCGEQIGGLQCY